MKTLKLLILVVIVGLSSCGIDESQPKPDYTKAGKQMFNQTCTNVIFITDWLDILLKMNTYIQAPIADKTTIEDKYFSNFKIRNSALNTWSLIQQSDTVYQIFVDGNPFTTAGAKWKIKKNDMLSPCSFTCITSSKWALNVSNLAVHKSFSNSDYYSNYNSAIVTTYISDSLNFESEITLPENFESNNFQISGKGIFLLEKNHEKVQISFVIEQNLKHVANSIFKINSGKFALSAINFVNSETETSSAEFETFIGDITKLTIIYKGKKQVYTDNNSKIALPY